MDVVVDVDVDVVVVVVVVVVVLALAVVVVDVVELAAAQKLETYSSSVMKKLQKMQEKQKEVEIRGEEL